MDPSHTSRERKAPGTIGEVRLAGVPVRFHFTFLFVIALLVATGLGGTQPAALDALFILALFVSVLLHELGHALAARAFGIRTLEIVLYPIGGVARMERQAAPELEIWIALAGPAVNVAIGAGLLFGAPRLDKISAELLGRIGESNLYLAAFNLLPAFPLDGGRLMRSALWLKVGEAKATGITSRVGKLLAVAMGIYGFVSGHLFLLLIAFLIFMAATQEEAASSGRVLTHGVPVREAMVTDFRTISHGATLREAAELLLATSQQDFPVVHNGSVVGLLDRTSFLRGMAMQGPDTYVASVMDRDFARVDPEMDLGDFLPLMAEGSACVLVMDGDRLAGMLTQENLSEFLLLRRLGMTSPRPVAG